MRLQLNTSVVATVQALQIRGTSTNIYLWENGRRPLSHGPPKSELRSWAVFGIVWIRPRPHRYIEPAGI